MSFAVPANLEAQLDELVTHYPQKRSASLMLLHALQEHFGYLSRDAIEWTAKKLGLQPINIYELVTFYPMFRQEPLGKTHIKVCRTLSCALAGSGELRTHFCSKLGLDPHKHAPQTTPDGKVTVEFSIGVQGEVASVRVVSSSGRRSLDEAAVGQKSIPQDVVHGPQCGARGRVVSDDS